MPYLIAIDGPAGAGKSTVARRIARELGFTYLDTGAMYRSVAWKAIRGDVGVEDAHSLEMIARRLAIVFSPLGDDGAQRVWVDGEEVTSAIRVPEVSDLTSRISAIVAIRATIVEQQRRIADSAPLGVVLEGRDIGTVVFPNADLKIFLTASVEERARRRTEQQIKSGLCIDAERTLAELLERDDRDSHREASPLGIAPDAVQVYTDGLAVDAVVRHILDLWQDRQK